MSATIDLEGGFEEERVGRPFAEVEVGVFDEDDRPCSVGQPGSVGIRSPAACTEYVGDPEATARTFRNGYAFPGDRGYLDDAGVLYVTGRADVINVGGDKVDPLEVENAIRSSLPVMDVVVMEGTRAGLPTVRVIAEANPAEVTSAMIVALCRERLSPHKVPANAEVRERLPRDENGKVMRALLDK
jgi:long-chain acyl-CoA synthetase